HDPRGIVFRSIVCDDINRVVIMTLTPMAWAINEEDPAKFHEFQFQGERLFRLIGYTVAWRGRVDEPTFAPAPAPVPPVVAPVSSFPKNVTDGTRVCMGGLPFMWDGVAGRWTQQMGTCVPAPTTSVETVPSTKAAVPTVTPTSGALLDVEGEGIKTTR